tara:strand:+ start:151 stop:951 length:801 start_codon:yes stop_codon:yes gene_type:complete
LKQYFKYSLFLSVLVIVLSTNTSFAQFTIPPKPVKQSQQTSIYDGAKLFTTAQTNALEQKLNGYADSTSTQVVIATVQNLKGDDISLTGAKWAQEWGVGQAEKDNGIFILVSKEDRQIDINTGYGIEYRMTDRMTERIINRIIIPQFKQNNYYAGLDQGTDAIFQALAGEFEETRDFNEGISLLKVIIIFIIFIVLMIILRRRKKGGGNNGSSGGSSLLDVIILSNMGRTGGFGSSGGFGGFGSGGGFGGGFGGGGFGGGGASGSW